MNKHEAPRTRGWTNTGFRSWACSTCALLLAAMLAGCGNRSEVAAPAPAKLAMARELKPPEAKLRQEVTGATDSPQSYLAYEHSVGLDVAQQQVAAVFEAAKAACAAATAELCSVLNADITTGRYPNATLRFRAKPAGVRKLIAALGQQGEIVNQSTSAEDLSGPITDSGKRLAMLNDYRTRLEALRSRASTDVEALIKVNHELAEVQSQLEVTTGERARLMQRVDTEILNVNIASQRNRAFWQPVSTALADFGGNLSQGVASVVTGVAFLAPWLLLLVLAGWAVRRLWRWRKRRAHG